MPQYITRMTTKGQVTVPAEIRRRLGLGPHDKVAFLVESDHVRIALATSVVARTAGMLWSDHPTLSPQQEKAAAEEAMVAEAEGAGA